MGVVKAPGLSFAGKITLVVKGVQIPGVKLRRGKADATFRLIWVLWVILLKLCLDVVRLKHLAGLNIKVAMLLLASLIVFGFMDYERPEAYPSSLEELVKLKLQIVGGIKRYR